MNYKLIVYELKYFKIQQKNRVLKKVYFNTIEIVHNIPKKDINSNYFKLFNKYIHQYKHIQINFILENQLDTLVIENNRKVEKYMELVKC